MDRRRYLALIGGGVVGTAGCLDGSSGDDPPPTPDTGGSLVGTYGFRRVTDTVVPGRGPDGNKLYVSGVTSDGEDQLTAIDVTAGDRAWQTTVDYVRRLRTDGEAVYCHADSDTDDWSEATSPHLRRVDSDGTVAWSREPSVFDQNQYTDVTLGAGVVLVDGFETTAAYDTETGETRWQRTSHSVVGTDSSDVFLTTKAGDQTELVVVSGRDGNARWRRSFDSVFGLGVTANWVHVYTYEPDTEQRRLHRVDRDSGADVWDALYNTTGLSEPPAVLTVDDSVLVAGRRVTLYGDDGDRLFDRSFDDAVEATPGGQYVFIRTANDGEGVIVAVDTESGESAWERAIGSFTNPIGVPVGAVGDFYYMARNPPRDRDRDRDDRRVRHTIVELDGTAGGEQSNQLQVVGTPIGFDGADLYTQVDGTEDTLGGFYRYPQPGPE